MTNRIVQLEVEDLAFDGKAVAHLDGKVVFLKGGLPGETVRAEIFRSKPRYEEGVVREILTRSAHRVPAPCTHFDYCGGCTWQDLEYRQQLAFKKKQVNDCLRHLGALESVSIGDVVGSGELFNYRNKMEFSFHVAGDNGFTLGLHRRGHFDDIFQLEQCHLQSEVSNHIVRFLQDYVRRTRIPVYDVKFHHGYLRFVVVRQTKRTDQLMVNLVTNYGQFSEPDELVAQMRSAVPEITTIVHNQNGQRSNIATGEIEQILFGPGYIEEQIFDSRFRIHANSFFQTNSLQAETLYRAAFDLIAPTPEDRVLDLYCGTGAIGILIAPMVKQVTGVELVEAAIIAARENAALNDVENIEFVHGDVTAFLRNARADELAYSLIIVDPPRAGLHPKALKRLKELPIPRLLYISCNPATFARDARELVAAGFVLPRVIPVDMFPHTMHIELVGLFHRA
ncbi:MAG: 23S rRNA (uracil(1939)-C(5))-methyltransferase RlmD [Candidatus Zixiibacteriota bacterium]